MTTRSRPAGEGLPRQPASEVVLEKLPGYEDVERLLEHGMAAMVRLTAGEGRVALKAAKWLAGYARELSRAPAARRKEERAVVIAELRRLYAAAPKRDELVLEGRVESAEKKRSRGGA